MCFDIDGAICTQNGTDMIQQLYLDRIEKINNLYEEKCDYLCSQPGCGKKQKPIEK